MKNSSEWMQGDEAETGDQGRAVTRVQAGDIGLEPGLEQWDGEEAGWEKRDSLRVDRGRDGSAATRCRILRPASAHLHPSPGHWVQAERPQGKPYTCPRLPDISRCCSPYPLPLVGSSKDLYLQAGQDFFPFFN